MIEKAIAYEDTTIAMNAIESCRNLLKTIVDPLRGGLRTRAGASGCRSI